MVSLTIRSPQLKNIQLCSFKWQSVSIVLWSSSPNIWQTAHSATFLMVKPNTDKNTVGFDFFCWWNVALLSRVLHSFHYRNFISRYRLSIQWASDYMSWYWIGLVLWPHSHSHWRMNIRLCAHSFTLWHSFDFQRIHLLCSSFFFSVFILLSFSYRARTTTLSLNANIFISLSSRFLFFVPTYKNIIDAKKMNNEPFKFIIMENYDRWDACDNKTYVEM